MKPLPDTLPRDLTVMVVDSDVHARNLLRRILLEIGVRQIVFAGNGQEALDLQQACDGPIDVVLSELHLPDTDGFSLFEKMHAVQGGLTFVMVSWDAHENVVVRARTCNLDGYLIKPIAPDQVQEKIVSALLRDRSYKSRSWLRSEEGLAFQQEAPTDMRALFEIWNRARGNRPMPPRDALKEWQLQNNGTVDQHIFIVDVEPPKQRLRYTFVGAALLRRLGLNVQGTYVDEQNFLYRRYAQPAYDRVIRHLVPHYRRVGAIEMMMMFRYQRLLLPFGDDEDVQTVLGCARPR